MQTLPHQFNIDDRRYNTDALQNYTLFISIGNG